VVAYEGLYEGIDLHTWGRRSSLKYEFHVAPGADYTRIAVRYDGIAGLTLTEDGALSVSLGDDWGELIDAAPYIHQSIDGEHVEVAGRYELLDEQTYTWSTRARIMQPTTCGRRPVGTVLNGSHRTPQLRQLPSMATITFTLSTACISTVPAIGAVGMASDGVSGQRLAWPT